MPSTLINESTRQDDQDDEFVLRDEDGTLTIEAETVIDFLLHADFSALAECDHVKAFIKEIEVDGEKVQILPAEIVAEVVDTDDLYAMFLNHLDAMPDGTLEEKARIAVWANFFGADLSGEEDGISEEDLEAALADTYAEIDADDNLDEVNKAAAKKAAKKAAMKAGKLTQGATKNGKLKKGGLTKLAKAPPGSPKRDTAIRMILAMLHKGIADRSNGGIVIKKGVSKKGGTAAGKQALKKYKQKVGTAESEEDKDPILFGHSVPLYGLTHAVQAKAMSEEEVAAFEEAFKKKGGKKPPKKGAPPSKKGEEEPMESHRHDDTAPLLEGAGLAAATVKAGAKRDMVVPPKAD